MSEQTFDKLIVHDWGLDELWLKCSDWQLDNAHIFNLADGHCRQDYPHINNPWAWGRWFERQGIDELVCFQPRMKCWALLWAAKRRGVKVRIQIVEPLDWITGLVLKYFAGERAEFYCSDEILAGCLEGRGVSSQHITVRRPGISVRAETVPNLRAELNVSDECPLLLLLNSPGNIRQAATATWATAMLYHLPVQARLIIAGKCSDAVRGQIKRYEQMYQAKDLFVVDDGRRSWAELVAGCDAVLADGVEYDTIRLIAAASTDTPLAIASDSNEQIRSEYPQAVLTGKSQARDMACALRRIIGKSGP